MVPDGSSTLLNVYDRHGQAVPDKPCEGSFWTAERAATLCRYWDDYRPENAPHTVREVPA